jgi:hypothetical protein
LFDFFFGFVAPAQALLHVLYPPHTLTCLPITHLYSHLAHFPLLLPFFSFYYHDVCLPLPLCGKVGNTALILASRFGHTATVELLLGAGADTEAKDGVRETLRANHTQTHTHIVDKMV